MSARRRQIDIFSPHDQRRAGAKLAKVKHKVPGVPEVPNVPRIPGTFELTFLYHFWKCFALMSI
jgi:hypothetical protein